MHHKKFTLFNIFTLSLLAFQSANSQSNFPLFDSTWYGFATGTYPYGQTPSAIKAGDLDNDGDDDLVVTQENMANSFVALPFFIHSPSFNI